MDAHAYPQAISPAVARLVNALTEAGLVATPFGASMVWACNRAADPPTDSGAQAWRLNPGLRQAVQLRACESGYCLGWFWVWHTPGEMPDYEYIAEASEVSCVAARVATVLAVRPEVVS